MLSTIRKVTSITKLEFTGNRRKIVFNFSKDLDELRNSRIWGIQTYYSSQFENRPLGILKADPDFKLPVITELQYRNGFLNLYDTDNVNFLINAPLSIFGTIQDMPNNYNRIPSGIIERDFKSLSGQKIDLQNSNVVFNGGANTTKETRTFFIDIYYSRIDLDKVIIEKLK